MGAADTLAMIGALIAIAVIVLPFIPGSTAIADRLMKLLFGILPLVILIYVAAKVSDLSDKVDSLERELRSLKGNSTEEG